MFTGKNSVNYEQLFSKLTPTLLLDHRWTVFGLIKWRISNSQKFTRDEILKILSREINAVDNPYYRRQCIRAQKIVSDVLAQLSELGLIKRVEKGFIKGEQYSVIFNFLKENFSNSATRRVAWAVWYIYNNGAKKFTTQQVLKLLSYSNKEYIEELRYLQLYEPYFPKKPILVKDLVERIFTAVLTLPSKESLKEDKVIQKVRELEKKSIDRILRKLKLSFENNQWRINNVAISRIREELKGKQSLNWPFFGNIIVRGDPYFKILRGNSCTVYVDVPNRITENLIEELMEVSEKSERKDDFYVKARKIVDAYNNYLRSRAAEDLGQNLDWLRFELYNHPFMNKYGVKISINWKKFMRFLEDFSRAEIPIWMKYRYIFFCRLSALKLVLRRKPPEWTQKSVREISKGETTEIQRKLTEFVGYLEDIKDQLMKILRRKKYPIEPAILLFLPEMIATVKALNHLVDYGAIPSCYREMRKILESLAWAVFDDILFFRSLKIFRRLEIEGVFFPPYRYISKEWYDSIQQLGKPSSRLMLKNLSDLKKRIKELIDILKTENWDKNMLKVLEKKIMKKMTYPMYLLLLGEDASAVKNIAKYIPTYDSHSLLTTLHKELLEGAADLNLSKELLDELIKTIEKMSPPVLIPPFPSNMFVLSFVDKNFSTSLQKKYDEYSFFIHSYIASWYIFPFSSVLEFKVLKHELKTFIKIVKTLLERYLEFLQ